MESTELASCVRNHRQLSCHLLAEIMNCSAATVQCIRNVIRQQEQIQLIAVRLCLSRKPFLYEETVKLGYDSSMFSHSLFMSAMCVDLLPYHFNACLEFLTY